MCKLDLAQYKDTWDVIIVDECHKVAGTPTAVSMFSKVLSSLRARHKYGLSATVHRADGLIKCTFAQLGSVKYIVPREAVQDKTMQIGVRPVLTHTELTEECLNTDGTLNYTHTITYLTEALLRNICIVSHIEKNRPALILSSRVSHLEQLMSMLCADKRKDAVMITGKMTTKKGRQEREKALEDMRTGKKKYLFATYQLAKEGLDIPCLERLYLATPEKDYAVIRQAIGRIERRTDDKDDPIVYDFIDDISFFQRMWKKRVTTYKKANCYFVED
jgi:superfamily II DNA or RNA helicase